MEVRIRLSTAVESSTVGTTLLDVTVEWEYTTVPSHSVRRFACVSERAEYNELLRDTPATFAWMMIPRDGMSPTSKESYELLEMTADGRAQNIRRSETNSGQLYHVDLDESVMSGKLMRLRRVFRTVMPIWSHRVFVELPQPTRGCALLVDYTNTSIAEMKVGDTVGSLQPPIVSYAPKGANGKTVAVKANGWLMPKTGFSFTWTLESELPRSEARREVVDRADLQQG